MKTLFLCFTLVILISSCVSNLMAKNVIERKTPFVNHGDQSPQSPPYVHFGSLSRHFIPEECSQICPEHCKRKNRFVAYCRPGEICRCTSFQIPNRYIATNSPKPSIK
ncbi:PREDICTED: putative defensin-like protein 224 [Camelina sativa]|uniref:Defensin-like protein 224 n=1 Tax=Camelina sativa TaxID=90675 RepID=A0ABM0WXR8_CAMSA|nr:PREDICTED: putative defensin-like protein 224 [Camelina sativa]